MSPAFAHGKGSRDPTQGARCIRPVSTTSGDVPHRARDQECRLPGLAAAPESRALYRATAENNCGLPRWRSTAGSGSSSTLKQEIVPDFRRRLKRSSIAMRAAEPLVHSGYETIAAEFGHQDLSARRVALDLLPKAVNMGFQRVGRHPGIVPPHLAQQNVAPDSLIAGAIEKFKDRRLLLGQPYLLATARIRQELGARTEGVGADREHRIIAVLTLAQMSAQPCQQDAKPKRLRHIVIGARIEAADGVGLAVGPGQHEYRDTDTGAAHNSAQFPPVRVGQSDVEQDGVETLDGDHFHRPGRGLARNRGKFFMQLELLGKRLA